MTPILTPLSDSETKDVAKSENEVLQQVRKLATHDKINDSIPPDEAVTSTVVEEDEVRDESVQPKPEPKYQYSENQWSLLNPGGKKQYDRNFLLKLQYEPSSMTRPVNLPTLPDILLNETTHGQTNDMVPRHHNMEFGRSSVAIPPDFLPHFIKLPPNGVVGRRKALTQPQYQSQIRVIRGKDNVGADCLSRNPLGEDEDEAPVCKSS